MCYLEPPFSHEAALAVLGGGKWRIGARGEAGGGATAGVGGKVEAGKVQDSEGSVGEGTRPQEAGSREQILCMQGPRGGRQLEGTHGGGER